MVKTTSPQKELGVQDDRRRDLVVSCVCFPFCCGVSTQEYYNIVPSEHEILKWKCRFVFTSLICTKDFYFRVKMSLDHSNKVAIDRIDIIFIFRQENPTIS